MQKEEKKKKETPPSPIKAKLIFSSQDNSKKTEVKDEVVAKKNVEEEKEEQLPNDAMFEEHDSDNDLDYEYGKPIDNSQPLHTEMGRNRFKNSKPLPMFKTLFSSDICNALKRFGGSPAPLSLIGTFLNYVGCHVLYYLYDKFKKRIFYPHSEVVSIRHLTSGEMVTTVNSNVNGVIMKLTFKSRAVIVSNGAKPSIPKEIFDGVPKDKLITGDFFLKQNGYESFVSTLHKNPTKRKIVIIGGSHSGFS